MLLNIFGYSIGLAIDNPMFYSSITNPQVKISRQKGVEYMIIAQKTFISMDYIKW